MRFPLVLLPLDRYCDGHEFSTEERLEIFRKVCSAVQYAHQNLVVPCASCYALRKFGKTGFSR